MRKRLVPATFEGGDAVQGMFFAVLDVPAVVQSLRQKKGCVSFIFWLARAVRAVLLCSLGSGAFCGKICCPGP